MLLVAGVFDEVAGVVDESVVVVAEVIGVAALPAESTVEPCE